MGSEVFFCRICGNQLQTLDEIDSKICSSCDHANETINDSVDFFCWACGKKLIAKSEIAQGVCHSCKASIYRKLHLAKH